MAQQRASDTRALPARSHVRMANQRDIAHVLKAHHAGETIGRERAKKPDAAVDLTTKVTLRHVRFVPLIGRNDASVRLCAVIADDIHVLEIRVATRPDRRHDVD